MAESREFLNHMIYLFFNKVIPRFIFLIRRITPTSGRSSMDYKKVFPSFARYS